MNVDITGLSQPITKLIELAGDSIKGLLAPWQMKRMTKAQICCEQMRQKALGKSNELPIPFKDEIPNRELRQLNNISQVLSQTIMELKQIKGTISNDVDRDWGAFFFDNVQDISDDEVQKIWAKILAGEIEEPGSFSVRTLRILKDLSKEEAEYFGDLADFIIDKCFIYTYVDDYRRNYPDSKFIALQDAGLLQYERRGFKPNEDYKRIMVGGANVTILNYDNIDYNSQQILFVFMLTNAGRELFTLLKPKIRTQYIDEFIHSLKSKNPNEPLQYETSPI